jgi:hypothetical protein
MIIEKWSEELKQFIEVEATESDIESMAFQLDYDAALKEIEERQTGWAYVEDVTQINKILQKD